MSCVNSLPAAPDERLALQIFLLPRALTDEQQIRVGAADAEHDLRATRRELAQRAVVRERRDLVEGGRRRVGGMRRGTQRHGRCYARMGHESPGVTSPHPRQCRGSV